MNRHMSYVLRTHTSTDAFRHRSYWDFATISPTIVSEKPLIVLIILPEG